MTECLPDGFVVEAGAFATDGGSNPGMIIGDDIKEYMSKIDEGPGAALAHLVRELIAYVESSDFEELARRLNND